MPVQGWGKGRPAVMPRRSAVVCCGISRDAEAGQRLTSCRVTR